MTSLLSHLRGKNVLIITHSSADVDAISSAAALYYSLSKNCKITIGVPDHISLPAKAFLQKIGLKAIVNPSQLDNYNVIILLDFNSLGMAGSLAEDIKNFKGIKILFDHHEKTNEKLVSGKFNFSDANAISTTEIIYKTLKKERIKISKQTALSIAAGIYVDSAGLLVANPETFHILAEMFEITKTGLPELRAMLKETTDISEKIAILKAARRCRIFRLNDYVIATTNVNCFEASASMSLVRNGADVAFAGSFDKGKIMISSRANNIFVKKTGLKLPEHIFFPLNKEFKGHAGGHKAAAGFNGFADSIDAPLLRCVELTKKFFEKKHRKTLSMKEY